MLESNSDTVVSKERYVYLLQSSKVCMIHTYREIEASTHQCGATSLAQLALLSLDNTEWLDYYLLSSGPSAATAYTCNYNHSPPKLRR